MAGGGGWGLLRHALGRRGCVSLVCGVVSVSVCARALGGWGRGASAGVRVRSACHGRAVASWGRGFGVGGLHRAGSLARACPWVECVKEEGCGGVCVSTSICVEIVCNCVYGSELIFGLGFWGVSLPVVGGDWAGDSGLTGGRGDKTLNFAQWVWSLGLVGAGGWVVSVAPPTRGSERAGGGGQETSCFRGLVQHLLSGWDACHS